MQYAYQSEKLSAARRCLMLPHSQGIETSIAGAFHECSLAFDQMDESRLGDEASRWVAKIKEFMDTSGISDPKQEGTWTVKARTLSTDQQLELSHLVDELAHFFERKSWES